MFQQLPQTILSSAISSVAPNPEPSIRPYLETGYTVVIVEDDSTTRAGLEKLLESNGYKVRTHASAEDFLDETGPIPAGCLLLNHDPDVRMTGLQVHEEMRKRGCMLRTVFLASSWSIRDVVDAMRAGADNFLSKPCKPEDLLHAVDEALQRARSMHQAEYVAEIHRARAASLTQRERQIIRLVVAGHLNKEIAAQLGLALITVKVHRARAMKKLRVGNPAELACVTRIAGL